MFFPTNIRVKLFVIHLFKDDPHKCTARKLKRFGLVIFSKKPPKNTLFLTPYARIPISPNDKTIALGHGITAVDASWKKIEDIRRMHFKNERKLPFLIASNPVNYGKPFRLSTAEAFSAALYIMNFKDAAEIILSKFKWGPTFLKINRDLLERYTLAKNHREVSEIEKEIINNYSKHKT